MERRMLLAVILSFLVVTLYSLATGRCTPPPPPEENGPEAPGDPAAVPPGPGVPAVPPGPGVPAPAVPGQPGAVPGQPGPVAVPGPVPAPAEPEGPQKDYVPDAPRTEPVVTTESEIVFQSRGAGIEWLRLRRSFEADKETQLDLLVPMADDLLLGQIDDTLMDVKDFPADTPGPLRAWHWRRDEAAEQATPELDVVYTFQTAAGHVWTKRFVVPDGENVFHIDMHVSWQPAEGGSVAPRQIKVLVSSGLLREPWTGAAFQYPNAALWRRAKMDEPVQEAGGIGPSLGEDPERGEARLVGARTHFYMAGWYAGASGPSAPTPLLYWATGNSHDRRAVTIRDNLATFFADVRGRDAAKDAHLKDRIHAASLERHHAWLVVEIPPQKEISVPLYVGPIERDVLAQEAYAVVKPVISYPFAPDIIAKALLVIYDFFRSLLGSAGLAVILMTLVVRGGMMPLSIKNQLSMRQYSRRIARIKPKLEGLKKKFGTNPRKMREEQSKLYREHGIGFPTGCLMMLVQIPIFFALFSSLRSEYTLRNESFLWIADLSAPDKLIDFGTSIPLVVVTVFSLNILPLLMVTLSIWQQKLMPTPADEQQAQQMRMMKWLPIIFAVILYNYTAALAIYMVLSSAVSITESRIVRAKDAHDQEAAAAEA